MLDDTWNWNHEAGEWNNHNVSLNAVASRTAPPKKRRTGTAQQPWDACLGIQVRRTGIGRRRLNERAEEHAVRSGRRAVQLTAFLRMRRTTISIIVPDQ